MLGFSRPFVLAAFCVCTGFLSSSQAAVWHVDQSAPPGGDGTSWASPFADLQQALQTAAPGDEIRVARGLYKPAPPGVDRSATFLLRSGMTLKGGYLGFGSDAPDTRNPDLFVTTLSGDLNDNDAAGNTFDNSRHVITTVELQTVPPAPLPPCTIDGFTIRAGYAESYQNGGGVYAQTELKLSHCRLQANTAEHGGALYAARTCTVTDCVFEENQARAAGGAVHLPWGYWYHELRRCTFRRNRAANGGAIDYFYCNPTVVSCTFESNQATQLGGAIRGNYYPLSCVNCDFYGNSANSGGGIWTEFGTSLVGCVFSGNAASANFGYYGAAKGADAIVNCTFYANRAYRVGGVSPSYNFAIRNSIFWGNYDQAGNGLPAQLTFDPSSPNQVLSHNSIQGWTAPPDGQHNDGVDPKFILPAGVDGAAGTPDDNLRLAIKSPAADSGDNAAVPADAADVDEDGDTTETLPLDIDGEARISNDPYVPSDGAVVNRGAYEQIPQDSNAIIWRSIKTHTNAGPQAIALHPTASGNGASGPTVEPRQGLPPIIQAHFQQPVQIKPGARIQLVGYTAFPNGIMSGPFDYSGGTQISMLDDRTVQISMTGFQPDQICLKIDVGPALLDADGNPLTGDTDCLLRILLGDVNGTGDVSIGDALYMKPFMSTTGSPLTNPRCDINLTGEVNLGDQLLLKSRIRSQSPRALCPSY